MSANSRKRSIRANSCVSPLKSSFARPAKGTTTTSSVTVSASIVSFGPSLATLNEMYFHCAVSGVILSKNRLF
jgi:hypothetical protein